MGLRNKRIERSRKALECRWVLLVFYHEQKQVAPLSMLIQLERSPELIDSINQHGLFLAEMKEWNAETHQAHIVVHPN